MAVPSQGIEIVPSQAANELGWEKTYQENLDKVTSTGEEVGNGKQARDVPVSPFRDLPRWKAVRVFWFTCVCAFCIANVAIMDGYLITIPGSIVANTYFINQFCTVHSSKGCALDARYVGAFTGVQSIGQILGMLGGPIISDRFGRKINIVCLILLLSLGVILEMVAKTDPVWLVARLFAGWGTGMSQTVLPTYISEIAPHMLRGALIATYNFWFGVGQFAGAIALQIVVKQTTYLKVIYSQWLFIGLMIIAWFLIPESPWYYLNKGQPDKAKNALKYLNGRIPGYDVELEYQVMNYERMQQAAFENEAATTSYSDIFKGSNRRRTIVSWLPLQYQGLGGLSFVLSYTTYFFQLAGFANPFLANVIVKCIQLSSQIFSWYNIERFGRRPLLLIGGAGMGLMCLAIAIVGSIPNYTPAGGLVVALFCIWTFSYSSSMAPLGYVCVAEMATPRLRAKTAGFASALTAMFGVFTNFVTPILLSAQEAGWLYKTGYLFFGFSVAGWLGMFFMVPETKGRTYEELDELFESRVPARKFPQTKTKRDLEVEAGGSGAPQA